MIDAVTVILIELFMRGVDLALSTFFLWKNRYARKEK